MISTASLSRTPSVAFFDRLRAEADKATAPQAPAALKPMLADYLDQTQNETGMLKKAERLLDIACSLRPTDDDLEKKPTTVLVEQFGGLCVGVEQLEAQKTVAEGVIAAMLPLVFERSRRARLSQEVVGQIDTADLTETVVVSVLAGLTSSLPELQIDPARLKTRLHTALQGCFLNEAILLAHASRLSESCLEVFAKNAPQGAIYMKKYTTRFLPSLTDVLNRLIADIDDRGPTPVLSAKHEALRQKLLELSRLNGNEQFVRLLSPGGSAKTDDGNDFELRAVVEMLRLWEESGLGDNLDEQLAFYRSKAGQEYLVHKKDIDAIGNNDIRKAQLGRVIEPLLEEASERQRSSRAEEMNVLEELFKQVMAPLTTMNAQQREEFFKGFSEVFDIASHAEDASEPSND